jgi:hypothetical protein
MVSTGRLVVALFFTMHVSILLLHMMRHIMCLHGHMVRAGAASPLGTGHVIWRAVWQHVAASGFCALCALVAMFGALLLSPELAIA